MRSPSSDVRRDNAVPDSYRGEHGQDVSPLIKKPSSDQLRLFRFFAASVLHGSQSFVKHALAGD